MMGKQCWEEGGLKRQFGVRSDEFGVKVQESELSRKVSEEAMKELRVKECNPVM